MSATVTLKENGLEIMLPCASSGQTIKPQYLNYMWLRDNCPTSWDPQTQDRIYDLTAAPSEIRAKAAYVSDDTLIVDWAQEDHRSHYPLAWITRWLRDPGHDDAANVPIQLWRAEHVGHVARFAFDAIQSDWQTRKDYMHCLLEKGLAVVEGVPDGDHGVSQTAEFAGIIRANFSGQFFNVRAYAKPSGSAFTAHALEPHTDNPCEESPPGLQYLHCPRNDATGGNSTFADGAAAAYDLKDQYPEDFEILSTVSVPFRYTHDAMDLRARHQVILTNARGEVTGVTISQHMADIFDLDQQVLDRFYPAFQRFLRMLRSDRYEIEFPLKSGECVVFDNQRIAHGRRSFDPTSGTRILRGCYTDRGELRSRYRVLVKDGYIRDFKQQGAA